MSQVIKVGGSYYDVLVQEHFEAPDNDRNLWGLCDYGQQKIYIRQSLAEKKKKQVLVHELTHAMLHEAGYKEQDEELVERLSLILHQVLLDNPRLML